MNNNLLTILVERYGDKLLLICVAVYFGHFAVVDGNQFAQHIADGVVGGLLTLIVQRKETPPNQPGQ